MIFSHRLMFTPTLPPPAHDAFRLTVSECVCMADARARVRMCPQIRGCCWRSAERKCQSTSANERYQLYLVVCTHTHSHTLRENKPGATARCTTCQLCTTMAPCMNSMQDKEDVAGSSKTASGLQWSCSDKEGQRRSLFQSYERVVCIILHSGKSKDMVTGILNGLHMYSTQLA